VLATLGGLAIAGKPSKDQFDNRVAVATPTPKAKSNTPTPTPKPNAATTINTTKSNSYRTVDKASPKLITGKVSQVDPKTRTFTLQAKGKEYRFTFQKIEMELPKVGAIVDVTYTGVLGGAEPAQSINLNSSRSNIY
jgi:hypothetical protein